MTGRKYDRYFTPIENSIQRMAKLTGQLLAYARGGKYRVSHMSMIEFVRETLPLVEHTLKPTITVETDLPEKVSLVTIDVTQMQTVLSGILSNASEAIEKAGHVLISCRDEHITAKQSKRHRAWSPAIMLYYRSRTTARGWMKIHANGYSSRFSAPSSRGGGSKWLRCTAS